MNLSTATLPMQESMIHLVDNLQKNICDTLGEINQQSCESNPWTSNHPLNGEGVANIFTDGRFLEKGGVNVSKVRGKVFGEMSKMLDIERQANAHHYNYFATGISIVLHPKSPLIPTIHANYRYFEIEDENKEIITQFFGGGTDLTPYYLVEEDAIYFHQVLKNACDKTSPSLYEQLKEEADEYFYLPHRKEYRGIGGIFSLKMNEGSVEEMYEWVQNCSEAFLEGYIPIVEKYIDTPYTEKQKEWQLIRRGRYVEFNLLYDVGTQFGFKSGGNPENILMSLPAHVSWKFNYKCDPDSPEEKLLSVIKQPRKWV